MLIWGIGGGVSLAALQIAKHLGARVIVTSSSERKLAKARELGADVAFNHAELPPEEIAREVRKLTVTGADVVVDSVGQQTWEASLRALRPGGRLVTCGATSGPDGVARHPAALLVPVEPARLDDGHRRGVRRRSWRSRNAGKLWPVVDSVVPLERGATAYERMARGEQLGKLVIEVSR